MTEQRIQSPIVGVKFVPGAQAIIDDTPDDATVKLVRHPENVFDSNAVGVHICGARVGYVVAAVAKVLAPIMDARGIEEMSARFDKCGGGKLASISVIIVR